MSLLLLQDYLMHMSRFFVSTLVMALNKSMHPRNRYKDKPPDFGYLASKYPDFQQHVHTSLAGKPVWVPESVSIIQPMLIEK